MVRPPEIKMNHEANLKPDAFDIKAERTLMTNDPPCQRTSFTDVLELYTSISLLAPVLFPWIHFTMVKYDLKLSKCKILDTYNS